MILFVRYVMSLLNKSSLSIATTQSFARLVMLKWTRHSIQRQHTLKVLASTKQEAK